VQTALHHLLVAQREERFGSSQHTVRRPFGAGTQQGRRVALACAGRGRSETGALAQTAMEVANLHETVGAMAVHRRGVSLARVVRRRGDVILVELRFGLRELHVPRRLAHRGAERRRVGERGQACDASRDERDDHRGCAPGAPPFRCFVVHALPPRRGPSKPR